MASYSTNEFRSGLKVLLDGEPCAIMENEFVKPGKGQAFNRVRLRNLKTGRMWERTFKSGESIEAADVMELDMEYLYTDGEFYHFMKTDGSFEQVAASASAVGDTKERLKEQESYQIVLWNDDPISVTAPNFIELEVVQTDPGIKGDTAQGGSKPATLSTGAVVKVPFSSTKVKSFASIRAAPNTRAGPRDSDGRALLAPGGTGRGGSAALSSSPICVSSSVSAGCWKSIRPCWGAWG